MSATTGNHVLALDDDPEALKLIVTLAFQAGYSVQSASMPSEFISRFRERRPDAAIMDLVLGEMDALSLLDFLGGEHFLGPVILVSGHDVRLMESAMGAGQDRGLFMAGPIQKGSDIGRLGTLLQSEFLRFSGRASSGEGTEPQV